MKKKVIALAALLVLLALLVGFCAYMGRGEESPAPTEVPPTAAATPTEEETSAPTTSPETAAPIQTETLWTEPEETEQPKRPAGASGTESGKATEPAPTEIPATEAPATVPAATEPAVTVPPAQEPSIPGNMTDKG